MTLLSGGETGGHPQERAHPTAAQRLAPRAPQCGPSHWVGDGSCLMTVREPPQPPGCQGRSVPPPCPCRPPVRAALQPTRAPRPPATLDLPRRFAETFRELGALGRRPRIPAWPDNTPLCSASDASVLFALCALGTRTCGH